MPRGPAMIMRILCLALNCSRLHNGEILAPFLCLTTIYASLTSKFANVSNAKCCSGSDATCGSATCETERSGGLIGCVCAVLWLAMLLTTASSIACPITLS